MTTEQLALMSEFLEGLNALSREKGIVLRAEVGYISLDFQEGGVVYEYSDNMLLDTARFERNEP